MRQINAARMFSEDTGLEDTGLVRWFRLITVAASFVSYFDSRALFTTLTKWRAGAWGFPVRFRF